MRNRRLTAFFLALASLLGVSSASAQPAELTPAQAADPPPVWPQGPQTPISTSGTDVAPPAPVMPTTPTIMTPGPATTSDERRRELDMRLAIDEARLKTLEDDVGPLRHLKLMGYVQLQYQLQAFNAAASPNLVNGALPAGISSNDVIAKTDGTTTNTNLFRLRRTRLGATYETDILRVFVQLEVFPQGGPVATQGTMARNAEIAGIAHFTKDLKTEFGGGLFNIPFRGELVELSLHRPFIERTFASQSLFPNERDLGVHAKTIYGKDVATLEVGILNGQRVGEKTFILQPDLNAAKDFYARGTAKAGPLSANLAGYFGRAQLVDPSAVRVKNFDRLGVNLGVQLAKTLAARLGETKLIAELLFGTNMDTGALTPFALPTIPKTFSDDVKDLHERALYLRVEQELTRWGIAGFRYDTYTTDSSLANNARDTFTLMAGARFSKFLRLINEASYAVDNLHPEGAAPPSRHIYGYTAWLQGSFY
jgi:hypothetical protein